MKTITLDFKKYCKYSITLEDDTAFKFIPPHIQKKKRQWYNVFLIIQQDDVGNRTIILPDNVKWGEAGLNLTRAPNAIDVISMYYCRKEYYAVATYNFQSV